MPTYNFQCKKCEEKYIDLVSYDPTGKYKSVQCPKCKSKRKTKLVNDILEVTFGNPRGTSKADKFTYVAGWNMNQAQEERRKAEALSHVGSNPYNEINDLNNDSVFGEVK